MDKIKKRDRVEIVYDILKNIMLNNNSIKPTPLMRYSNLSTTSFNEYMKELKEKGLVKELKDKKNRNYLTLTDKGFEFINKYKQIKGFIEEFNL